MNRLCEIVAEENGEAGDAYNSQITFVTDRPGHDKRYAIDCTKIKSQLGWKQSFTFDAGLRDTVRWYLDNGDWIESVRSGEYRKWIERNYDSRG